jgi:hypothetical protein
VPSTSCQPDTQISRICRVKNEQRSESVAGARIRSREAGSLSIYAGKLPKISELCENHGRHQPHLANCRGFSHTHASRHSRVKPNVRAPTDGHGLVTSKWDRGLLASSSSRLRAAFARGPSTAVNGSPQVLSKTTFRFTEKPSGSPSVPFDDGLLISQHRFYETDIMFKWAQQQ